MITDEQLDLLYEKHSNKYGEQSIPEWYAFCRELIALAQEVKPLEFESDEDGDYVAFSAFSSDEDGDYVAVSAFGRHFLYLSFTGKTYQYNNTRYNTLDEAIEAANADYRRRVLSCLVWGDV